MVAIPLSSIESSTSPRDIYIGLGAAESVFI